MKKYINGTKIIYATEKAYEILYKQQGFKEVKDVKEPLKKEVIETNDKVSNKKSTTSKKK